jgi:hypothetical protein
MPFDPYAYDLAAAGKRTLPSAAAQAREALPAMPAEARQTLCAGLRAAVQDTLDLRERTPPGVKREPPAFNIQHAGGPCFNLADLRRQTLDGWHQLTGLELRLAVQVLEALILTGDVGRYERLLAEQCARIGQLYRELERRAGAWMALALLRGELRLLRYRASAAVSSLIYD